jgi:hypothetical protein
MDTSVLADATVLAKTSKGLREIEHKECGLRLALRRVLILVDGKRTFGELCSGLGASFDAPHALEQLLDEGFVKPLQQHGTAPESARSAVMSLVRPALGAHADKVLPIFERSEDNPDALAAALASACKVIKLTIDERLADELLTQGKALLRHSR